METLFFTPEMGEEAFRRAGTWGLASVMMRKEKSVARHLMEVGARVYLPLRREERAYKSGMKEILSAFCPGNLFVAWSTVAQYSDVWCVPGLFQVMPDRKQFQMVTDMVSFGKAIEVQYEKKRLARWQKGQRCKIRRGHRLEGMSGWLTKDRADATVQFGYPLMGTVMECEVAVQFVELTGDAAMVAA